MQLRSSRSHSILLLALTAAIFAPPLHAKPRPPHPYRYSILDIPISLASGTITTPEFTPLKTSWQWILLQVEKPLPFLDMSCLTGVSSGPLQLKECSKQSIVHAHWKVFSEGTLLKEGNSVDHVGGIWDEENIFKFIGSFPAQAKKRYTIEITFTDGGTALDIANPHLIVVKIGEE